MGSAIERALSGALKFSNIHPDDAYILGPHLRAADRKEVGIFSSIEAPVEYQLQLSLERMEGDGLEILDEHGILHGMFGHAPWGEGGPAEGYIWLLSDDALFAKHKKTVHRIARDYFIPRVLEHYGSVGNYIHADNEVHLKWLARLGFKPAFSAEIKGNLFHFMKRDV